MKKKKITKAILKKREKRLYKRQQKEIWIDLRQKVKERQKDLCYLCNKQIFGKSAHIHHIVSRDIKELCYDSLNLVLLCPLCHKLAPLSVHQTAIYFSEILRTRDSDRYYYLLNKININK